MTEERSIYDMGNAGIAILEQAIIRLQAENARLQEATRAAQLSRDQALQAAEAANRAAQIAQAALREAISEYQSIANDNYEGTKHMASVRRRVER